MKINSVYLKKCCYGIFVAIMICIFLRAFMNTEYSSVEAFFIITYGGIVSVNAANILYVLILSLPVLIQLYMFSDVMSSELGIASAYIFTRAGNKITWFNRKCIHLLVYTIIYYSVQVLVVFSAACLYGYTVHSVKNCMFLIFDIFLLWVATTYTFILGANILALKITTHLAFFSVWLFYTFMLVLSTTLKSDGIKLLLPCLQSYIAYHDSPLINSVLKPYDIVSIPTFYIGYSVFYCFLAILCIYLIGKKIFINSEFISSKEVS